MKIIAYIFSGIFYLFGILFVWGAFGNPFDGGALAIGLIMLAAASVILWIVTRKKEPEKAAEVTYKVDLGGDIRINKMTCEHCGGPLSTDNITIVAGAPTVTCPYCGSSYQITEEPKW